MKKSIFFLVCFFSAMIAFSQRNEELRAVSYPAAEGTYQYLFTSRDTEENIQLTQEELVKLEQLRKEDTRVNVVITDKTTIILFSLQEINSPDFVKPSVNKIYLVECGNFEELKTNKKTRLTQ